MKRFSSMSKFKMRTAGVGRIFENFNIQATAISSESSTTVL